MKQNRKIVFFLSGLLLLLISTESGVAQYANRWMNVGSLHNWFSEIGNEKEQGYVISQQYGLQWPAIYDYQDNQAAKGFWIGTTDFTDSKGDFYPNKVVHIGPRVTGEGEFYPVQFDLISKFDAPNVFVEGVLSFEKQVEIDAVDPQLSADRMFVNVVNSSIGLTMTRKIMQFSQQFNDNYMIYEYTFTNTGNADDDSEIEYSGKTLTDLYFYYQYRYSSVRQTRYLIGNKTGWGIMTMNDARGDGAANIGLYGDPADERFRAQFSWHGYWPDKDVPYDNMGAPIWYQDNVTNHYIAAFDTLGRIGAPQFCGILTLHADTEAGNSSDNPAQPQTTSFIESDMDLNFQNNQYDISKMTKEYALMTKGNMTPRHAWKVQPSGDFTTQKTEPALGTAGGYSFANGYGPYTLEPGESVTIIMAEAVAGLGRDMCNEIGKQYKNGQIDAKAKNTWVMTGRDSLFQTFRRIQNVYENGYVLPDYPKPPKTFQVDGGGDRIQLRWELFDENDPNVTGFRIYRVADRLDNPAELIYEAGSGERSYDDTSPVRGVGYYYYIETLGQNIAANASLNIPATRLRSSRYYTQSYDPAFLKRPAGNLNVMRVVPNPFILSSDETRLRFGRNEPDKLAFFNIPGQCTISIYTEIGEKIYSMHHTDGSGDAYWNGVTMFNQIVVSGIYIAVVEDEVTGDKKILKFVVIR